MRYDGAKSCLFINGTEIFKIKAKDSKFVAHPLCLGNISKDWSVNNMKKMDLMVMFMILGLTMILHSQLFDEKK